MSASMSSEQSSVNSETIEQTKQQIRGLVGEIAQLSKSGMSAEEYYPAFLQRIVSALAAVGGAVWLLGDNQRPRLSYQINISDTLLDPESEEAIRHVRLMNQLVRGGEPQLVPPLSGAADEEAGGNPTRYLLVLAPLLNEGRIEGLIEIFQRPDSQPATQRGYLRFLVQMCELAAEWLKGQQLKVYSDRHSLWAQADHFSRMVHESLDLRETAYTIVNEGRRMIGCDRVAVAIKTGRKCKVEAISGQDTIENRSNIINALNQLSTRVVAMGEPLWYDGLAEDLPPQVEEALDHYVDESYAKSVVILPLRKPGPVDDGSRQTPALEEEENLRRETIGALIIEQIETDLPRALLEPRVDLVYEHSARAISNSKDHTNLFLMPVWKTLGKAAWLVKARTLPKTLFVAAAILIALIALFVVPKDFELEANGKLLPVERREVFVDVDGDVMDVLVEHGAKVTKGQPLVKLRNTDLTIQMADLLGQLQSTRERLRAVDRRLIEDRGLRSEERNQYSLEQAEYRERLQSLERQLELLAQKQDQLTITSPIDGEVITWDVDTLLKHRPVVRGQVLMTVANPDGDWELELLMPDKRSRHLDDARKTLEPNLPVKFILGSDPDNYRHGKIHSVQDKAELDEEDGLVVKVKVRELSDLRGEGLADPRPGTKVIADVYAGRAPIGYVWFHEAIEWVKVNVFF
ncbi:MAG: efflux RND transporter periplasmic adaptor subunit [Planctomycetales bacterium]|nr:efflux RND transporter periplasmic adaptor subunit [Planctomycetales bacterium]